MVVGFNHNFTYKGAVYHIQTEDSGRKSPTIVTLLYHGGTILASRKTSYADIARVDNLEQVVEELMKEQHKGMLRSLKNGEFDEAIERFRGSAPPVPQTVTPDAQRPAPASEVTPGPASSAPAPPTVVRPAGPPLPAIPQSPPPAAAAIPPAAKPATAETSLDEIILSYLMGKEK